MNDNNQQRQLLRLEVGALLFSTINNLITVPEYDMNNIEKWVKKYEFASRANNWTDDIMFNRLYQAFEKTQHVDYFFRIMENPIYN